jgi:hypothetical protein
MYELDMAYYRLVSVSLNLTSCRCNFIQIFTIRHKIEHKLHLVISHSPAKEWLQFAYSTKIFDDKLKELTS